MTRDMQNQFNQFYLPINQIVQNGMNFDPKNSSPPPGYLVDIGTASTLFHELEEKNVDYMLVGGVALLAYVNGRNTQDIDIVISKDQISLIDWDPVIQDENFGRGNYHGVVVDFLFLSNPLFSYVFKEKAKMSFLGKSIPTATANGLLLLKLYALPSLYRNGQLERAALYEADIRMLLLLQGEGKSTHALRALTLLSNYLISSDISELARIIEEQTRRKF